MALTLDALRRRLLEQAEQDTEMARQERDYKLDLTRGQADINLANQRDESDYNRSIFELGKKRDFDLERLDENLADRGTLRSGMNLVARGRLGEEYGKSSEALARRLGESKEDRARALAKLREDTERRLADLRVDKARITTDREQQKAIDEAERLAAERAAILEQQRAQQEEAARIAAMQPQYTPTGQYLPPDPEEYEPSPYQPSQWATSDWYAQNAAKPSGESMPEWQRMGFPNEESWRAIYRRMGG